MGVPGWWMQKQNWSGNSWNSWRKILENGSKHLTEIEKGSLGTGKAPSPGLANPCTGPAMHALQRPGPHGLHNGVHRVGHHEQSRQHPCGYDHTSSVGARLPHARLQWSADGAVPFQGDGHQA